jgi:hypothetical protein
VIPLIDDISKIQLLIENSLYGDNDEFLSRVIVNPEEVIKKSEIIYVKKFIEEAENIDNIDNIDNIPNEIESGTVIKVPQCSWEYIPYNLNFSTLLSSAN